MRRLSNSFFISTVMLSMLLPLFVVATAATSFKEPGSSFAAKVSHQRQDEENKDPRLIRLQQFFAKRDCPIQGMEVDFLAASDQHDLDWRLLPSISIIESGGGKAYKNNNIFGWDSCNQAFPSIEAGIHVVASRLAHSKLYKGKELEDMLRTYNSERRDYVPIVKSIMNSLGPADLQP